MWCLFSLIGCNAEQMKLWGNEGRPLMQLIHFSFSLGGLLSPLYTEPFLATPSSLHQDNSTAGENWTVTQYLDDTGESEIFMDDFESSSNSNVTLFNTTVFRNWTFDENVLQSDTSIHWAYLITSILTFLVSIPFLYVYFRFRDSKTSRTPGHHKHTETEIFRKLPKPMHLFIVTSLCCFGFFYMCLEDTLMSFLMAFSVQAFSSMTKSQGAYTTAMFWGASAGARFLAIFISRCLSPVRMLYTCAVIVSLSFVGITLSTVFDSTIGLSVCVSTSGLGLAAVFASNFLWIESEVVQVTGALSSGIFVFGSVGKMLNPVLISFLMEEVSIMWYCYMLLIYFVAICSVFGSILLVNRFYLNSRFGHLRQKRNQIYTYW